MFLQAVELRARCGCPALPDPDPRVVFSMSMRKILEKADKERNKAEELKERERVVGTQRRVQPQLGAALALSAQQHPLLRKEGQRMKLLRKEVSPETNRE